MRPAKVTQRFHSIINIGMVTTVNSGSMAFCEAHGFRQVGVFKQVESYKFNQWLDDEAAYELLLSSSTIAPSRVS